MKTFLLYLIILYFGTLLFVFFFSDALTFYPPTPSYKDIPNIIKLKTKDGAIISAMFLFNENAKYTLLFSHGNAEDMGNIMPFLHELQKHGFSIFVYDYHGYGTSTGRPTTQHAYNDVNAAYDYMVNTLKIPERNIIAFGRSVGAALAIDIASRKPIAGVIAQSPFLTAFRAVTQIPLFPFDKFNNLKKIKTIHCHILIIHGTSDRTIPFWQGKKLFQEANPPKQHFWVKHARHNNILQIAGDRYFENIMSFINNLISS